MHIRNIPVNASVSYCHDNNTGQNSEYPRRISILFNSFISSSIMHLSIQMYIGSQVLRVIFSNFTFAQPKEVSLEKHLFISLLDAVQHWWSGIPTKLDMNSQACLAWASTQIYHLLWRHATSKGSTHSKHSSWLLSIKTGIALKILS